MGQILHSCARTTEAVRRAIQDSKESIAALSEKYSINHKTVIKWRKRDYVHDSPMGPKNPRSTVLSLEEEAVCVAFRKHALLPLDDCLYALQPSIPNLTVSRFTDCFSFMVSVGCGTRSKEKREEKVQILSDRIFSY